MAKKVEPIRRRVCVALIQGVSLYSQSHCITSAKDKSESHIAFEERAWRERCRCNADDRIIIPGDAFKKCLAAAAQYRGEKIPGQGNSTWSKHFRSGIQCPFDLELPVMRSEVKNMRLLVPSDGKAKSNAGKVWKRFPVVLDWGGPVEFWVVDPKIQQSVFEEYLVYAGLNIGVGRWRPENGGSNGMFEVSQFDWK